MREGESERKRKRERKKEITYWPWICQTPCRKKCFLHVIECLWKGVVFFALGRQTDLYYYTYICLCISEYDKIYMHIYVYVFFLSLWIIYSWEYHAKNMHTYFIFLIDVCMQNSKVDAQCKYYNISLHFSLNNIKHLHFMYMYWHNKWIYTKSSPQANLYNGRTCRRMDGRANGCTDI